MPWAMSSSAATTSGLLRYSLNAATCTSMRTEGMSAFPPSQLEHGVRDRACRRRPPSDGAVHLVEEPVDVDPVGGGDVDPGGRVDGVVDEGRVSAAEDLLGRAGLHGAAADHC